MEAENTLTITKEISSEFFFKEESRRLQEAFMVDRNVNQLNYLQGMLMKMSAMMRVLELPWERYIPLLFRIYAGYMNRPDGSVSNQKISQLMAMLMESIAYLSQNGKQIHDLCVFFENQAAELNELLSAKETGNHPEETKNPPEGTEN